MCCKTEFYEAQSNLKQHLVPIMCWALLAAVDVKIKLDIVSGTELSNYCHVIPFSVESCPHTSPLKCVHSVISL